jgi:hypothetical protein
MFSLSSHFLPRPVQASEAVALAQKTLVTGMLWYRVIAVSRLRVAASELPAAFKDVWEVARGGSNVKEPRHRGCLSTLKGRSNQAGANRQGHMCWILGS